MPYPVYSERIEALTTALRALGCTVVFDWPAWTRTAPVFPDGRGLADRPVADAAPPLISMGGVGDPEFGAGLIGTAP